VAQVFGNPTFRLGRKVQTLTSTRFITERIFQACLMNGLEFLVHDGAGFAYQEVGSKA